MELIQKGWMTILLPFRIINSERSKRLRYFVISFSFFVIFLLITAGVMNRQLFWDDTLVRDRLLGFLSGIGDRNRTIIILILLAAMICLSVEKTTKAVKVNWYFSTLWNVTSVIIIVSGIFHNIGNGYLIAQFIILLIIPELLFIWKDKGEPERLYELISAAGIVLSYVCAYLIFNWYRWGMPYMVFQYGRFQGMTKQPNYLGVILCATSVCAMYMILRRGYLWTAISAVSLGVSFGFLAMTISRTSILATAFAGCFFLFFLIKSSDSARKAIKKAVIVAVVIPFFFFGAYDKASQGNDYLNILSFQNTDALVYADESSDAEENKESLIGKRFSGQGSLDTLSSGRIMVWKAYMSHLNYRGNDLTIAYPLKVINQDGTGYTYFEKAHNFTLEYAFRSGYLAAVPLLLLQLLSLLFAAWTLVCKRKRLKPEDMFAAIVTAAFFVSGAFESISLITSTSMTLMYFLAMGPLFFLELEDHHKEVFCPKNAVRLLSVILVVASIAGGVNSAVEVSRAKAIYKGRAQYKLFPGNGCSDFAVIITDKKKAKRLEPKEIDQVMVVNFEENGFRRYNVLSVDPDVVVKIGKKDKCENLRDLWDRKKPQIFCDYINKSVDLNVRAYVAVNTKTIYKMLKQAQVVRINVRSDSIDPINKKQEELKKKYHIRGKIKKVTMPGVQPLNPLQALAYMESPYVEDVWDKKDKDHDGKLERALQREKRARTRKITMAILKSIHGCSMADIEQYRAILFEGDHNFNSDYMLRIASRVQGYSKGKMGKWPKRAALRKWKGKDYRFVKNPIGSAEHLHKNKFGEWWYMPSDNVKELDTKTNGIFEKLREIRRKKLEEKRRLEEEAKRLREEAERAEQERVEREQRLQEEKRMADERKKNNGSGSGNEEDKNKSDGGGTKPKPKEPSDDSEGTDSGGGQESSEGGTDDSGGGSNPQPPSERTETDSEGNET